jgi:hypothetical protein
MGGLKSSQVKKTRGRGVWAAQFINRHCPRLPDDEILV